MTEKKEEFKVSGDEVVKTVKKLIREGNIRRIIIKNEKNNTLVEFPLTIGVVGTALIPVWAAIGAIAALVTNCTIVVEKRED
jgi:DNA-binding Lrp family transcriptional regulator